MEYDVFLYGRTKTYDYTDMYMPSWLTFESEAYSDYRRIISHLFRIRDILSEDDSKKLEHTADSFYFYHTRNISILCRCCHIVGKDEYGRSICSTEGFICKKENEKNFWLRIPDMLDHMTTCKKTFYDEYMENYSDCSKSPQIVRSESLNKIIDFIFKINNSENVFTKTKQFTALLDSMHKRILPFNFIIGDHNKSIYSYKPSKQIPDTEMYFVKDECTELSDSCVWNKSIVPYTLKQQTEIYYVYIDLQKSPRDSLKYRLVVGNAPDDNKTITDVPFVSYERESGTEIDIADICKMYEITKSYLHNLGWSEHEKNKYIFEKW